MAAAAGAAAEGSLRAQRSVLGGRWVTWKSSQQETRRRWWRRRRRRGAESALYIASTWTKSFWHPRVAFHLCTFVQRVFHHCKCVFTTRATCRPPDSLTVSAISDRRLYLRTSRKKKVNALPQKTNQYYNMNTALSCVKPVTVTRVCIEEGYYSPSRALVCVWERQARGRVRIERRQCLL